MDIYSSPFYNGLERKEIIIDTNVDNLRISLFENLSQNTRFDVVIKGQINGSDILAIKDFSHALAEKSSFLNLLDLSGCYFVRGGESYYTISTKWMTQECFTKDEIATKFIFYDFVVRIMVLPLSCKTIEKDAFSHNVYIEKIICNATKLNRGCISFCPCLKTIELTNNVKTISCGSFYCCENISNVTLYDSSKISVIDKCIYSSNKLLLCVDNINSSFVMPDNVITISHSAFYGKVNFHNIVLNDKLRNIGDYAFKGTSITALHLPSSIKNIGLIQMEHLEDLFVYTSTPCPVSDKTFFYCSGVRLHVPSGTLQTYKNARYWNRFKEYIEEDYEPLYCGQVVNHVTAAFKGKESAKLLKGQERIDIQSLDQLISFADVCDTVNELFKKRNQKFWLLLRNGKICMSEDCIIQLKALYPRRRKELVRLECVNNYWIDCNRIKCVYGEEELRDIYEYEQEMDDLERDTYYALGGEDYDSFVERGGDMDSFMDSIGL